MNKAIVTDKAPAAIGAYSQGITVDGIVFTSGQLGIDPGTGVLVPGIEAQTVQSLNNIKEILAAEGKTMADVVKTTVMIKDINDFAKVNTIYSTYFSEPYPARSCYEVANLPKGGLVEIEVIAK